MAKNLPLFHFNCIFYCVLKEQPALIATAGNGKIALSINNEITGCRVKASSGDVIKREPNTRGIEWVVIFAFWTLIALLQVVQRTVEPRPAVFTDITTVTQEILRSFAYFYGWALLTPLIFRISAHYSPERRQGVGTIALHVVTAIFTALLMDVYEGWLRWSLGLSRSGQLVILDFRLLNELIIFLAIMATGFARSYFYHYRARREDAARLRAQLAEARLQTLRSQLNPHFLFNTLHAISSLVERDPGGVRRMIARLSELLRHTLDGTQTQEIALKQEIRFLERYLEIEQIRFEGKLEIRKDIPPDITDALLPNLILQPLVENAIKHGIAHRMDAEGYIGIRARLEDAFISIVIEDNGPGLSDNAVNTAETGVGLRNTRERLRELYGDTARLETGVLEHGGFRVYLYLPYHTGTDLRTSLANRESANINLDE